MSVTTILPSLMPESTDDDAIEFPVKKIKGMRRQLIVMFAALFRAI